VVLHLDAPAVEHLNDLLLHPLGGTVSQGAGHGGRTTSAYLGRDDLDELVEEAELEHFVLKLSSTSGGTLFQN
ncbi:unnamed protein product, partial [Ixodes pacificus]